MPPPAITDFKIFMPRSPSVATTFLPVDCSTRLFFSFDSDFLRSGSPSLILSNLPSDAVDRCVATSALMVDSLPRSFSWPSCDFFRSTGTPDGRGLSRSALPPSLPALRLRSMLLMVRLVVPLVSWPACSAFFMRLAVFLSFRDRFSSLIFSHGSSNGSSLAPTSTMGQFCSLELAFSYPVRYIHSPVASSKTLRDRFSLLSEMPFALANFSHLVSCLGGGGGNARGRATSS
mmetsp:Transcript_6840/g.20038  ORF Transcript_6840/g.20038 Transcript_6840/m.20038 type:complete len:232 (-) Transcript_6840:769-1464(-)